jgi:hypothetical protein
MGKYADLVAGMSIKVTSPDGNIRAEFVGGHRVTIQMRPQCYERYSEDGLARQLDHLGRLVHVGYRRGLNRALYEVTGEEARNEPHWDARIRRFEAARSEVEAFGTSPGNCVRATAIGLLHWNFRIRPGTLNRLGEDQLLMEVDAVVEAVRTDNNQKVSDLTDSYFGKVKPGFAGRG